MAMNSYDFSVKTSQAARTGYEKRTPQGASFRAFRAFAKSINKDLRSENEQLTQKRKEITKTYSQSVALEKIRDLDREYKSMLTAKQDRLREILNRLISSKQNAISQYTMTAPTEKQLRLIDSISRRVDSLSDTEWNMLVSEVSGNYQAAALVRDLAKKADKSYTLPFNPEDHLKMLNDLSGKLSHIIDSIDQDPLSGGYETAEFLSDTDTGLIMSLCDQFDNYSPGYTTERISDITDQEDLETRLLQARRVAFHNQDQTLHTELCNVNFQIKDHGLSDDLVNRAEQLITYVNTLYPATEKDRS